MTDAYDEMSMDLDDEGLFDIDAPAAVSLAQEFLAPPFSILDTRQGYWQDRKRAWIGMGLRSELGRDSMDGTGKSLTYATSGGTDEFSAKLHAMTGGTSIFDPVLCELVYRWFTPPGGRVLDPFAGGSVRGLTASILGRHYVGLELRAEQVEANRAQVHLGSSVEPVWITTDALHMDQHLDEVADEFDLIFTCPPYADLEVYSNDPRDLSTMDYAEFIATYRTILFDAATYLRRDRFFVIVVGEVRDKKTGLYRNFVGDTVDAVRASGLHLYNTGVLVNAVGTAAMRTPRQFRASRKFGLVHQHVLVFVKGDPKAAADACGPISVRHNDPAPA